MGGKFTPLRVETLTPFHQHSLAVPSGTATLAAWMSDRTLAYGIAGALGALHNAPALPTLGWVRDISRLPFWASMGRAKQANLLKPRGCRLNLDAEGGYDNAIQGNTGSGNLKTWFHVQEVQPGAVYEGALFGADPFALAGEALGLDREASEIVFRFGRHRAGIARATRADLEEVHLNLHTGHLVGADMTSSAAPKVEVFALYDMQVSVPISRKEAALIVEDWRARARRQEGLAA